VANQDQASAVLVDEQVSILADLMRTLVVFGNIHLATAASWIAEPDDVLDGLSPAAWIAAGRDPDRLRTICRQDAARLAH
jgi:hypothetical protein